MVKMYNRPIYHSSHTNVHPYSLEEYLSAAGVTLQKHWQLSRQQAQVAKHFDDYFHFGGFPELVNVTAKRAWLTGIYNKIFFSDIVVRNGVRNEDARLYNRNIEVEQIVSSYLPAMTFDGCVIAYSK